MKYIQIFLFVFLGMHLQLSAAEEIADSEIREIESFIEIDFDAFKPGDVVAFDVDDVLIEPEDVVGIHTSKKSVIDTFNQCVEDYSFEDAAHDQFISIMLRDMKYIVIESDIIEKIRMLKERGVIVIALTSCRIGRFGVIESYEKMRHSSLKEFGFTWSFEDETCIFNHLKKEGKKNAPLFFKGIIIVGSYPKGDALGAFLAWKNLKPRMIFFVDNNLNHLYSVKKECEEREIPFIGYHYFGGSKVELDEAKMHKQFQHLVQHKAWLSDRALQDRQDPINKKRKRAEDQSNREEDLNFLGLDSMYADELEPSLCEE